MHLFLPYLQSGKSRIIFQVFASETEEQIGLLNRAAPRSGPLIDWDPDIVETLDDEFKSHDLVFNLKEADLKVEDGDEDDDELDAILAQAKQVNFFNIARLRPL
jgi:Low temperature viability protein